jgi:integrase
VLFVAKNQSVPDVAFIGGKGMSSEGHDRKNFLTNFPKIDMPSLSILLQEEDKEMGVIRAKGRCPKCGRNFEYIRRLGYMCRGCQTIPKRFYIDLWFGKRRIRLFSDKSGQVLDSFQRAQNLLSHINYEIKNHTFDPSKYVTSEVSEFWVTTLMDRFLEFKIDSIAPSYKKDYIRMANLVKQFFGTKDVRELRKLDIVNFKNHLGKNFNFKAKTTKNIIDFLKTFLRYLKFDLEVIDNIPAFPEIETQPPQFKWLSGEEQIKLFQFVPEQHRPIISFLMLQGVRPGEARALRCKDVDLKNETITISATFSSREYRPKRKGRGSQPVTIPIHPEIYDYLSDRVRNNLPEAYVFVNPNTGRHYAETTLRRVWNGIRKRAGINKSLRLYDATRHSFASQLVNSGSSLFKVAKLLGHSSVKTTEKYAHANLESLRTDLNKLSLTTVTRLSPAEKSEKKAL